VKHLGNRRIDRFLFKNKNSTHKTTVKKGKEKRRISKNRIYETIA